MYNYPTLDWDNTVAEGNPISDYMSLYQLYVASVRAILNIKDA
jgi:hypothetical protein